jgi:hypothetical protein
MTTTTTNFLLWEGGSLDDLLPLLSEPALSARVEVIAREGGREALVGELHLVAGGIAETMAGALRGDAALATLKAARGAVFRIEPRLPEPESGGLFPPGPGEGTLAGRAVTRLMRYCEDFVLTGSVELARGSDRASLGYRRGELVKTVVNGSEDADHLPEVISWKDGTYRIVLAPVALPRPSRAAPAETPATGRRPTSRPTLPLSTAAVDAVAAAATRGSGPRPAVNAPGMPPPVTPQRPPTQADAARPHSRGTLPGFLPSAPSRPEGERPAERRSSPSAPVAPAAPLPVASAAASAPAAAAGAPGKPARRGLSDLPLAAHVGLGLALGLGIVGAYWLLNGLGTIPLFR